MALAAAPAHGPGSAAAGLAVDALQPGSEAGGAAAELRLVSVLFVDLVGFTSLSESREAEDVRELLGRYFDSARTIVERYGGTVEKFIGDAVMAVWGAPVAREDDAERAVRAALDVVEAVGVFASDVSAPDLRARAGVVTGQVAAMENPGEGLVVGDRVNTASRVQSAAAPGSVFVDEVTRQVTSAAIAFEDAGEHEAKGKAEPLRLWRAVRVVAAIGGSEREQGVVAPFVGRDGDLRLLKELFHQSLDRRSARLVAVSGEAGVGKTRLRREFFQYIDGLAGTVLWHAGRCLSYGEGVAYWALAEMVRQRLGVTEDASALIATEKLSAGLERWVPDATDREFLEPRLGALLGVAEPGLGREELFAGWRMFFERLAAHEPVALVFEDLQWADQGLLEFIGQMLDWSSDSPIFILTLARPELGERHQGWPAGHRGATTLQLEPLEESAIRELLAGVVDGLPVAAADRIVAHAEGVPLYAIETVRALADRGVLVERDGKLVLEGELGELDVPASLGSLLAARLDALEPEERQLVKAMSVFGGSFPRASAAALAEVNEDRLDPVLSALVRKQVLAIRADRLSPDRGQYAFAQGLLRTVAYEMLSRQERKTRHLAAAEHLGKVFPDEGEEVAEVIANHLLDAYRAAQDDPDADVIRRQAVGALRRAAHRALTVGAPETAGRCYLRARDLADDEGERTELTQSAGEMAMQSGRVEAALELFDEAAAAHGAAGRRRDSARAAGRSGFALIRIGRDADAIDRFRTALDVLAGEEFDPEVGALNAGLGRALVFSGDIEQAIPVFEQALEIAAALQLPELLAGALETRGLAFLFRGRVEEARLLLDGATEIADRHNLAYLAGRARTNSSFLRLMWDLPGAEQPLEVAMAQGRRRGDVYHESVAAGGLAASHLIKGRWDDAERLLAEMLSGAEERPAREGLYWNLVVLNVRRGETAAAREHLGGLSGWAAADDPEFRSAAAAAEGLVLAAEGRLEEVLERGRSMLSEALGALGASTDAVRTGWPETLRAALALGRLDDAHALLALLGDLPPGRVPPYLHAELVRGHALVAAAEGRDDSVDADLLAALQQLRALGYPYHVALVQTDLAHWLIGADRGVEAGPLLKEAVTTLEALGAAPALTRAQGLMEGAPDLAVTEVQA